ncbi:MAG TPA: hypothetical protein VGA99_00540, partial [bacterium]
MKTEDIIRKTLTIGMLLVFVMTNSGCFKRVAVPIEKEQVENKQKIYVLLISGQEYKITNPRMEGDSLVGKFGDEEIKIPLSEVKKVEILQPDEKKTIRNALILMAVIVIYGLTIIPPAGF